MTSLTVACVQTTAAASFAPNIAAASTGIRAARAEGAELVALPENIGLMAKDSAATKALAEPESTHPVLAALREEAARCGVWVLVGSLAIRQDSGRLTNRSFLLNASGEITARYDKIHLFEATLPSGETYREADSFDAGTTAILAPTPWGKLGMTVCYDMRFPALYRTLAEAGASILAMPSAFTVPTGQAHWHVLLRARAIETGCFVIAPAQCGTHENGRRTYGHSLIVSPWGEVLADGGDTPGLTLATLDLTKVAEARQAIPALANRQTYSPPQA
jgi:deaminated glutathione amidase